MLRTNSLTPPTASAPEFSGSGFDDEAWLDDAERDGAAPLVHLCGATALAILALATASLVLL